MATKGGDKLSEFGLAMTSLGRPVDVLALLRSEPVKESVIDAITAIGDVGVRAGVGQFAKIGLPALTSPEYDLLLLDLDLGDPAELALLEDLLRCMPSGRPIVATSMDASIDGLRHLLRLGIADFVPQPIRRTDLIRAFAAAIERTQASTPKSEREHPPAGKIICFLGAGGGMGTTSLAVQSACALADDKSKASVGLIDFDIQTGNVALYLDLQSKSSVVDLNERLDRLDGSMLRTIMAHHRSGVDVLGAPGDFASLDAITPEGAARLLYVAKREYRHIILDLPRVWTRWTRTILGSADAIVLVLQPSVPAVRQARREMDMLAADGLDTIPLSLVLNRQPTGLLRRGRSAVALQDAAKALGRDIAYAVPNDYRSMLTAINTGVPLAQVKGGRKIAKRISAMIRRISAEVDAEARAKPAAQR